MACSAVVLSGAGAVSKGSKAGVQKMCKVDSLREVCNAISKPNNSSVNILAIACTSPHRAHSFNITSGGVKSTLTRQSGSVSPRTWATIMAS